LLLGAGLAFGAGLVLSAADAAAGERAYEFKGDTYRVLVPEPDAERGRKIFVLSGCVLCHGVNGVGGGAAPPLDAPEGNTEIDPLNFSARMWAGATAMSALQAIELGVPITLTGEDIADLAAFASIAEAQTGFSIDEVPEHMRQWILEEPYWEHEDWPVEFREGEWQMQDPDAE
jgi:mono/diheme cytochrome c family protein